MGCGLDTIVHDLLALLITWKSGVLGVLRIGPCLHPAELSVGLIGTYRVDECAEIRFVGGLYATVVAGLLQGDIVPLVKHERLAQ